jgi:hypothetical protein
LDKEFFSLRTTSIQTKSFKLALLFAGPLCVSSSLLSSGYLPLIETREKLKSHSACFARLQTAYNQHRSKETTKTEYNDSSRREVVLVSATNGVAIINRFKAQYVGRIWHHNGIKNLSTGQIETSHSWDEVDMRCAGKMLISTGSSGYTQSTFDPLQ